jgi:tRNA (cytidine/uridine-2'-O-)-methyltransferase
MTLRLALYQPDIPQNAGTLMRLCAGLGVPLDVIEPCGFIMNDKNFRRAAMDYIDLIDMTRHIDWHAFMAQKKGRLILLTAHAPARYTDFAFEVDDILLAGRESAGAPENVASSCDAAVAVPMRPPARCLNVAVACSMVLGEALRQTRWSKTTP